MNLIFGTGGFAKEIEWLIQEIFKNSGIDYRPNYFVTKDDDPLVDSYINGVKIVAESEIYSKFCDDRVNCFIAVGEPVIKEKIYNKIREKINSFVFPVLIHPNVTFDDRPTKVIFGEGSIVCSMSVLTTDIALEKFVLVNLGCTIGHESSIGSFSTLSPGAHVSGNVHISDKVYIGTGAVIIQNINISNDCLIGAGSVVTKDIYHPGTYVGMPARKIK